MAKQGRLRVLFQQEVIRKTDDKLMVKGLITSVLTRNGRPLPSDILVEKFVKAGIKIEEI